MKGVVVSAGVPRIAGTELAVGAVVERCYQTSIDGGLGEMAFAGLDRAALEAVLGYCAEQRCARKMRPVRAAGCARNGSASRPSTISLRRIAEVGFSALNRSLASVAAANAGG